MSPTALRRFALFDVVGISLLVPWYIWRLQFQAPRFWAVFPIWIVASFLLHHDTPKTLGWRADNLWAATKQVLAPFAILAIILFVIGLSLGTLGGVPPNLFSLNRLWAYFAFCLLQQVVLQSFLNNRLLFLLSKRGFSSLLAGAIFAISHWPNPVLVPATFIGGSVLAWLFARQRNIIPLAIAQALLGSLVWMCFPVAWHHHLHVGPGYYRPL